jgi:phage-related tail fiber protein
MHIITSGTSNIQLKIDPSVVLATRQYVDESMNGLLPANKPAGTYTKVTVNDRGVFVSGSNPTTLAGYGITDTYTKDQITAMIGQASALPVGAMVGFPLDKVAPGFLELDGSVKSASAYPDLATFLGGAFNKGDEGAGHFRLPESRGEFLRGWDHGRGVDAGRAIGSMQLDSLQGFRMETMRTKAGTAWGNDDAGAGDPGVGPPLGTVTAGTRPRNLTGAFVSDGVNGVPRVGSETRPRSLAVMWCIKAWNAPINQGNIDIAALVTLAAQATEINQGTAKVATQPQVNAGIDDSTIVTPKKLRAGFSMSLGVTGYVAFPSWLGGFVFQWGVMAETQALGFIALIKPST